MTALVVLGLITTILLIMGGVVALCKIAQSKVPSRRMTPAEEASYETESTLFKE
jgi:hypothetical protein